MVRIRSADVRKTGLGVNPVRTFASAPAGTIAAKAPIYLRAFAQQLDLDNLKDDPTAFKPSLYTAYKPVRRATRTRRKKINCSYSSIISTVHSGSSCGSWPYTNDFSSTDHIDVHRHFTISDIDHFFPLFRSATPQRPNLLIPENLVHPGMTTVLTIGLSPALQEILEPATNVSYRDAQIGLTVFANLFAGLVPLMEAFQRYRYSRVMPLIAKLESLGLIDTEGVGPNTHLEYTLDSSGVIETLRCVFEGRNESDVRTILGDTLLERGQDPWFAIHEEKEMDAGSLSLSEAMEMSEHWDSPVRVEPGSRVLTPVGEEEVIWDSPHSPSEVVIFPVDLSSSNVDLILPTPNTFTGLRLTFDEEHNAILTPPEPYTYPSNRLSDTDSPSPDSSQWSPSASVISRMVGDETPTSDWSAPPSEADSDLDGELSSVWSEGEDQVVESMSGSVNPEEEENWRSTVSNGGLMQPW